MSDLSTTVTLGFEGFDYGSFSMPWPSTIDVDTIVASLFVCDSDILKPYLYHWIMFFFCGEYHWIMLLCRLPDMFIDAVDNDFYYRFPYLSN